MKITATVTREKAQPFSIEELEIEEPRSDEVLVKVAASSHSLKRLAMTSRHL